MHNKFSLFIYLLVGNESDPNPLLQRIKHQQTGHTYISVGAWGFLDMCLEVGWLDHMALFLELCKLILQ